jgi:excisionase family DNA binding protein
MSVDELPEFAPVPAVAKALGMSVAQIWRMVASGQLPSVRLSTRVVRIPRQALKSWLENRVAASRAS